MVTRKVSAGLVCFLALTVATGAAGQRPEKQAQKKRSRETAAGEGAKLYKQNCAVCHGNDGTGGAAPRSSLFTKPAPDLTTLAKRHGGKFPEAYVAEVLRNGVKMHDHGPAEMPVWGRIFKATTSSDEAQVRKRIDALDAYLKEIQAR